MYRVRFHGRGGQGIKTASRILGTAFFLEGFQVQDAPRYGAERRGAPIFGYVRAGKEPIHERGVIAHPDLVVCVDDTLVTLATAGVWEGMQPKIPLLLASSKGEAYWRAKIKTENPLMVLSFKENGISESGLAAYAVACAGAAAAMVSEISARALKEAVKMELDSLGPESVALSLEWAVIGFNRGSEQVGLVSEGAPPDARDYRLAVWVRLENDSASVASPTIYRSANSNGVKTGLWRTERPVIDLDACKGCWWVCTTYCPDSAVLVTAEAKPEIDYDHCKGCLICVEQCPSHAIMSIPEREAGEISA